MGGKRKAEDEIANPSKKRRLLSGTDPVTTVPKPVLFVSLDAAFKRYVVEKYFHGRAILTVIRLNPIGDKQDAKTESAVLRKKRKFNKKFRRMAERHADQMKLC